VTLYWVEPPPFARQLEDERAELKRRNAELERQAAQLARDRAEVEDGRPFSGDASG
jgi:hypothetical protein